MKSKLIKIGDLIKFNFKKKLVDKKTKTIEQPMEERKSEHYWKKTKIKSYRYSLEFDDVVILSRILINKPSSLSFSLEISIDEDDGQFIQISQEERCKQGALKVLDFHFMPCKYVHFTMLNSQPFPEEDKISCYGFTKEVFEKQYGKEMLELVYKNVSGIMFDKHDL